MEQFCRYKNVSMNTTNWTLWLALAMTYCVLTYNPIYQTALLTSISIVALSKRQPLGAYVRMGLLMSTIPLLVNIFLVHYGKTVLYSVPLSIHLMGLRIPTLLFAGPITLEAAAMGLLMTVLLVNAVSAFQVFNSSTSPDAILNLMPKSLPSIAMVSSISMRFMPSILRDYASIRDAQMCRGVRLNSGSTIERMSNQAKMITPTIITSLERAFNISESMAARGYSGARSRYARERWDGREYALSLGYVLAFALSFAAKYAGLLAYWPHDSLVPPAVSLWALAPLAMIILPAGVSDERD
jgi:energy-coupling factor transport system permease protein